MKRPPRLLAGLLIAALLCVAATVEAQRQRGGFGGGRGGFGFGTRAASPKASDASVQFCRVISRNALEGDGAGWSVDWPRADINFSIRLSELTKTHVGRDATGEPKHLLI